jgi:hypothetical protein
MAAVRLVYIGGGSTRAPGTVAALVERGAAFAGSEIVLVDLDPDRLDVVRRLLERMAAVRGVDLRVSTSPIDRPPWTAPMSCSPASGPAGSKRAPSTRRFRSAMG